MEKIKINLGKIYNLSERGDGLAELIMDVMNSYDDCEVDEIDDEENGITKCYMRNDFAEVEWEE
jgi:hypothetical protein